MRIALNPDRVIRVLFDVMKILVVIIIIIIIFETKGDFMNHKGIVIFLLILEIGLIFSASAGINNKFDEKTGNNKFDEKNKTLIINNNSANNILMSVQQVSDK